MKYMLKEHLDELFADEKDDSKKLLQRVKYLKEHKIEAIREKDMDVSFSDYAEAVELFCLQELSNTKETVNHNALLLEVFHQVLMLIVYVLGGSFIYYGVDLYFNISPYVTIPLSFLIFLPIYTILHKLKKELKQYE